MNGFRNNSVVLDVQENDQCINELDKRREDRQGWIARLKKRLVMADTISSAGNAATATNSNNDNNSNFWVPSIYRIPMCLREVIPAAYEPQVLSLGPYHHDKPRLQAMGKLKWWYLKRFLRRNPKKDLEDYLTLVEELKSQAHGAYSELESPVDSKDFIQMMLLDCCFVLEFLLINDVNGEVEEQEEENKEEQDEEEKKEEDEDEDEDEEEEDSNDPIGNTAWAMPFVLRDMLLLENQLPFFLLERLLEINIPNQTPSLSKIILRMFRELMPGKIRKTPTNRHGDVDVPIHHILHLMYSCTITTTVPEDNKKRSSPVSLPCLFKMFPRGARKLRRHVQKCNPCSNPVAPVDPDEPTLLWIPCAKKLREAGVVFKKKEDYATFLDVTFKRGIMEIPPLQILGNIDSLFRNLIAFEQCHTANDSSLPLYISAYAYLMNFVVDTPADVQLLKHKGIIVSTLGSDDDVASLFNELRKNTTIDENSYLASVFHSIQLHCNKKLNKWKATLNHSYFSNPWVSISVAAAVLLFVLTIMQTILAFFSYLRPTAH